MIEVYDIVARLTAPEFRQQDSGRLLDAFSAQLGWRPSDHLVLPRLAPYVNAHLVVEHGLENTAVLSFLREPWRQETLEYGTQRSLLGVSYNNLVDWHVHIDHTAVAYVYNRTKVPTVVDRIPIDRQNYAGLSTEAFERAAVKRPTPNLLSLDAALTSTIGTWKRRLSAELGNTVSNEVLSALFNSLIFVRAIEDHHRRLSPQDADARNAQPALSLSEQWDQGRQAGESLSTVLMRTLRGLANGQVPGYLIDEEPLRRFDALDAETVTELLNDFYRNRFAPYAYDFSLMSKHALSRIYERYVSLLRLDERAQIQLPLLPALPDEEVNRSYGSIYTPQFIARFFARCLRDEMGAPAFRQLRTIDPACGSGIFLRTLLELQWDPLDSGFQKEVARRAFVQTVGLEVDESARRAATLSLALLHLVTIGDLPKELHIKNAEAVLYFLEHRELAGAFDAVVANPPFVRHERQLPELNERFRRFLGALALGRVDSYLAFLKLGIDLLKPGGFGLFVLPHNFLLAENARRLREYLAKAAWIRYLADLSAIRVFESADSYVILLVFQKKTDAPPPAATVVRCTDHVSRALQDAADGRAVETPAYSIYGVDQKTFQRGSWLLLPPIARSIEARLRVLPRLDAFMEVRLGLISGQDEVFVVTDEQIRGLDSDLFVPFLPDKEMLVYATPDATRTHVFYPFADSGLISEDVLREQYRRTWAYLEARRPALEKRSAVRRGQLQWWQPERPRSRLSLLRPKIVTPHVVLVPRFGLDRAGRYAVSHSPYLYPKEEGAADEVLRFFVGVLNSTPCYWYISNHSHVVRHGYSRLEVSTLRRTPVPDPSKIAKRDLLLLLHLVDQRMAHPETGALDTEQTIDSLVCDLYELTPDERRQIGMMGDWDANRARSR